ncbi:hypothetical protein BSZ35_10605 [Salinibacter sp. 10B]|nr:hypothetical protein BSZ35_10605 [Salinibacter sp. 10B]
MNTKLFMSTSGIFLGFFGITISFFPREILTALGATPDEVSLVLANMVGAMYLGVGMLNWMARGNLIGGVYSRPVALGNFVLFVMIAITLSKQVLASSNAVVYAIGGALHAVFAGGFGYVLFGKGGQCG